MTSITNSSVYLDAYRRTANDQKTSQYNNEMAIMGENDKLGKTSTQNDIDSYNSLKDFNNALNDFIEGKTDVRTFMETLAQLGAFNFSITTDANGITTITCTYNNKTYTVITNDPAAADMGDKLYSEANDQGITLDELVGAKVNIASQDPLEVQYNSMFQLPCDNSMDYNSFLTCVKHWTQDQNIIQLLSKLDQQDQNQLSQLFRQCLNDVQSCQTEKDIEKLNIDVMMNHITTQMSNILQQYTKNPTDAATIEGFVQNYVATSIITDVIERVPQSQQGSFEGLEQLLTGLNASCLAENAIVTTKGTDTSNSAPTQVGQSMSLKDFVDNYKDLIKQHLNDNNISNRPQSSNNPNYYDDAIIETTYQYNSSTRQLDLVMKVYVPQVDANGDYVRDPNNGMIIYDLLQNFKIVTTQDPNTGETITELVYI